MSEFNEGSETRADFQNFKRNPKRIIGAVPIKPEAKLRRAHQKAQQTQEEFDRLDQEYARSVKTALKVEHGRNVAEGRLNVDPLTGLRNKRALDQDLSQQFDEATRYNQDFSIIEFDLDNFKGINDSLGHEGADGILVTLGQLVQNYTRSSDKFYRRSGDEFFLISPFTSTEDAKILAERIREAVQKELSVLSGYPDRVFTTSMGVAGFNSGSDTNPMNVPELLLNVEKALQNSKRTEDGKPKKNAVTVFTSGMDFPPGGENGREINEHNSEI